MYLNYRKQGAQSLTTERPTQQSILDSLQDDHTRFQMLINRLNEEQQQIALICEHDAEHFEIIEQYFEMSK
jgi:hypothetical protein